MLDRILVTWSSGFIGFHLSKVLLEQGYFVLGIDVENDYYDVNLKKVRRERLLGYDTFSFEKINLKDHDKLLSVFQNYRPNKVVNLAAQAGVRYSVVDPYSYIQSNIVWFHNLLEISHQFGVVNFVYASTWSVYGNLENLLGLESDSCEKPLSLYAASKKTDELLAHAYSYTHQMQTVWLRFFNVVWPWWRPDSALFIFTKNILEWKPVMLHNAGEMWRNNTYVGDIVDWIVRSLEYNNGWAYDVFNLGNERLVKLSYFLECIEKNLGKTADVMNVDMVVWELPSSNVDSSLAKSVLWWNATVSLEQAVEEFVRWYKGFYMA